MQNKTKISFVCPSFNHEKYINNFIDSVLAQTVDDFELIIVDDCSNDNTVLEIEKFQDKRIKLIKHNFNMGINATLCDGIRSAGSDLISIIASDDMLAKNYVEEVLNIFADKNNDVLYVSLNLIDEYGVELKQQRIFDSQKTKYDYLLQSFMGENPVPSPGMVFKKFAINNFLPLPFGMFQYSDWDLNNKFFLNNNVFVSDKPLVNYRVSRYSVSARNQKAIAREELEVDMLLDNFLANCNLETFKNIFKTKLDEFSDINEMSLPYFFSLFLLSANNPSFRKWGYKKLISLISHGDYFRYLNNKYKLTFADIISLCPVEEKTEINVLKNKLKKYKKGLIIQSYLLAFVLIIFGVMICLIK